MTRKHRSLKEIVEGLPVNAGDVLWVSANLTRLAMAARRTEGRFSADELIELLQEKVGREGTLVIPAFNHNLERTSRFDIRNTRPETGALSLVAFGRNDFVRTRHPLHSFMVWGKLSDRLERIDNKSSFGKDSPFAILLANDAQAMFIGTSVSEAFSFTHYAEEKLSVGYRKYRHFNIEYTDKDGITSQREYTLYAKKRGWTMCLGKLQQLMHDGGLLSVEDHNGVLFSFVGLKGAFDLLVHDISTNRARNIACFNTSIYLKELVKSLLGSIFGYRTLAERIRK
jgi:aminoglycoside 3-N-acetyltransferase